jgi:hypothetical protein
VQLWWIFLALKPSLRQHLDCGLRLGLQPHTCEIVWDVFFALIWCGMLVTCQSLPQFQSGRTLYVGASAAGMAYPLITAALVWRLRTLRQEAERQRAALVSVTVQRVRPKGDAGHKANTIPGAAYMV